MCGAASGYWLMEVLIRKMNDAALTPRWDCMPVQADVETRREEIVYNYFLSRKQS